MTCDKVWAHEYPRGLEPDSTEPEHEPCGMCGDSGAFYSLDFGKAFPCFCARGRLLERIELTMPAASEGR